MIWVVIFSSVVANLQSMAWRTMSGEHVGGNKCPSVLNVDTATEQRRNGIQT